MVIAGTGDLRRGYRSEYPWLCWAGAARLVAALRGVER